MDCKTTYNPLSPLVDTSKRISNQLSNQIAVKASKKSSFKDISEESDLSITSTISVFKKQIHEYRCSLTEVICIDEFKASTIAGTYALIIGDPISGVILDILPSRRQDYLTYYFQTIGKEETSKVKYVVSDLYEAYRTIIQSTFPKAVHIADRFHWIRQATEAFNRERIKIMNFHIKSAEKLSGSYKSECLEYATLLKQNYKLLLSNRASHEQWYYDQVVKKDKYGLNITMNNLIEQCLNKDSDLEESYILLQELYRIAKYSNYENIKNNLINWCKKVNDSSFNIPELKKVTLTYNSWLNEIVNSFILNPNTHSRMTNGFIEGKNNFCKVIKRIGFGYKDFDLFRNRILNCNRNK